MNKRTKALSISVAVKGHVYERDKGRCILCGSPYGMPDAHYISRAHSGLGTERNIVTLCRECHRRYDQTVEREALGEEIRAYLTGCYPGWDEAALTYKK